MGGVEEWRIEWKEHDRNCHGNMVSMGFDGIIHCRTLNSTPDFGKSPCWLAAVYAVAFGVGVWIGDMKFLAQLFSTRTDNQRVW